MIENIPPSESRFLYPVALDVRGRHCLVVGGGTVGARKAVALADAGAAVTIIAPELCADARILVNDSKARHIAEPFTPAHLDNAFLVVVATDSPAVNAEVAREARQRNILANMAAPGDENSDTDSGDFATMATVRRGDLLLAVTTGGAGPALSAKLRRELSERFGEEWEPTVSLLSELRVAAKTAFADPERRTTVLRRVAGKADHFAALYKSGDGETARKEAFACLSP